MNNQTSAHDSTPSLIGEYESGFSNSNISLSNSSNTHMHHNKNNMNTHNNISVTDNTMMNEDELIIKNKILREKIRENQTKIKKFQNDIRSLYNLTLNHSDSKSNIVMDVNIPFETLLNNVKSLPEYIDLQNEYSPVNLKPVLQERKPRPSRNVKDLDLDLKLPQRYYDRNQAVNSPTITTTAVSTVTTTPNPASTVNTNTTNNTMKDTPSKNNITITDRDELAALAAPATSVSYTTSRISISSPNKKKMNVPSNTIAPTFASANTTSAPTNTSKTITEPPAQKSSFENESTKSPMVSDTTPSHSISSNIPGLKIARTPLQNNGSTFNNANNTDFSKPNSIDFSPTSTSQSQSQLNLFNSLMDTAFDGTETKDRNSNDDNRLSFSLHSSDLKKSTTVTTTTSSIRTYVPSNDNVIEKSISNSNLQASTTTTYKSPSPRRKSAIDFRSPSTRRNSSIMSMPKSDIPLFVQPSEIDTIKLEVLSTLYSENEKIHDDPSSILSLFSVIDRSSDKEMFKFSKNPQQIYDLAKFIHSDMPSQPFPKLPSKQTFESFIPAKIDYRLNLLNEYFRMLSNLPVLTPKTSFKVAEFLSTDTVMRPLILDDEETIEGPLIMRKTKTLGNTTPWKLKHGVLDNGEIKVYENSIKTDEIRLKQANLEIMQNSHDDRNGAKNGFIITEHKKSALTANPKYFFCTETLKQRENWIKHISIYMENEIIMPTNSRSSESISTSDKIANEVPTTPSNIATSTAPSIADKDQTRNESISSFGPTFVTDLSGGSPYSAVNNSNTISNKGNDANPLTKNESPTLSTVNSSSSSVNGSQTSSVNSDKKKIKMRNLFPFKKVPNSQMNNTNNNSNSNNNNTNSSSPLEPMPENAELDTSAAPNFILNITNNNTNSLSTTMFDPSKFMFGAPIEVQLKLSSHLYKNRFQIPSVIFRCVEFLYKKNCLKSDGIFRLSGSSILIKAVQEVFDREFDIDLLDPNELNKHEGLTNIDVNVVCSLLKLYLRKLPHSIIGDENFNVFNGIVERFNGQDEVIALEYRNLVKNGVIKKDNLGLSYALFDLLNNVIQNKTFNRMGLRNLSIVFSTTLQIPANILQPFIVDFNCIFEGGLPLDDVSRRQFME
ncbi:hypothetical protein TBLA_0B04270 [Henningerozyma blattae CBS 6284]|uniref:Rho-GAP domain-containing protein n=1 Tax=Henningerozyma blattae (strain ATCC 34711 / CBS 6284 / DSM 70876 / NBRC 10599 / NRRL Y-10934 / UCD 77-7) TaxID=1071380 RepID=I2GYR3_HENB6|nr:hypothetical protein TBLA_0B04270 [Tetrapisispora blattae CBS 6284]CCH59265.1 hypothetical protein TBLA_0B04270 [Tetrapisispora blattae CBS 6284]